MSFEEEFDSIIRRKAEGESYPFDESNWEKTSALLDAERNAGRALKIKQLYLPVVLVLAIGTASVMTYNYFDSVKGTNGTTKELAIVVNETSEELKTTEESLNAKSSTAKKENLNESSQNSAENNSQNTNVNIESHIAEVSAKEGAETAEVKTNVAKSNVNSQGNITTKSQNVISSQQKQETFAAAAATSKQKETKAVDSEKQTGDKAEQFASDTKELKAFDNSTAKQKAEQTEPSQESSVKDIAESAAATSKQEAETTSILPASAASETNLLVNADQLSAVYSTLPLETTDQDVNAGAFVYLDRYDDEYYKKKNAKTHYLNIEFGANYLLGWNAAKGKDGDGMNWYAGFNYGRYFGNKFNVSLGLQAYNIANIKQPFYLVAAKEYGFGSNLIYTRVTSNELYYVAVPLKFNYMINRKNSVGLGVNAAYLIGATNTVSKYYTLDNELRTVGPSDTQTKGVYKGTNRMNLMLSANYKTQLVKRFGLNVEFNYGLSDMFKNTEEVKTSEVPMGVRVGLIYTIFDK